LLEGFLFSNQQLKAMGIKKQHLGFPAPLLGTESRRLPLLADFDWGLVLQKPAGVLVTADNWYPQVPVLIEAIRYQAAQGRPEFQRQGIPEEGLWAVTELDPELTGPVLFARDRVRADELKNRLGSSEFTFLFEGLSTRPFPDGEEDLVCELPLSRHTRDSRMLVSHTTGKRSLSHFRRGKALQGGGLWQAEVALPRRHQVLLHATELGLPVLGDERYARSSLPLLSQMKPGYRCKRDRDERPLFPGPALYLKELRLGNEFTVSMDPPERWEALLKQIERYGYPRKTVF
jgi:23S rRNA-/tRNA-specific pseudouridylate synthase